MANQDMGQGPLRNCDWNPNAPAERYPPTFLLGVCSIVGTLYSLTDR